MVFSKHSILFIVRSVLRNCSEAWGSMEEARYRGRLGSGRDVTFDGCYALPYLLVPIQMDMDI